VISLVFVNINEPDQPACILGANLGQLRIPGLEVLAHGAPLVPGFAQPVAVAAFVTGCTLVVAIR
jgi:hypothetical protein